MQHKNHFANAKRFTNNTEWNNKYQFRVPESSKGPRRALFLFPIPSLPNHTKKNCLNLFCLFISDNKFLINTYEFLRRAPSPAHECVHQGAALAVTSQDGVRPKREVHRYLRGICSSIGEKKAKKIPEAFLPPGPAHHQTSRIQVVIKLSYKVQSSCYQKLMAALDANPYVNVLSRFSEPFFQAPPGNNIPTWFTHWIFSDGL